MELAPIVLFVYNRPEHTRACLEYLERNELAAESELYVFADGATGEHGAGSQCDCGGDFGFGDARPGDRLGR